PPSRPCSPASRPSSRRRSATPTGASRRSPARRPPEAHDMTEVQDRSLIAGCMDMTVAETLDVLAELKSPVVRTCHYGNTPANNLGWIALAKNTYFGSMDHTLYGIDDIFLPWVLLGDRGRVEACFDHRGEP